MNTPFAHSLKDQEAVVLGLGRSGVAAARLLASAGARVTVTDAKPQEALRESLDRLPPEIKRELGGHKRATFAKARVVVVSPGVPEIAELAAARAAGAEVLGEIELAWRLSSAPVVAVTGTNGKSTTTALAGLMLQQAGRPTFVGGNLGVPYADAVGTPAAGPGGMCVIECSSFQLETVTTFRPRVGVLLNVTDDHLDRHVDVRAYAATKARLFAAQGAGDFAVLNADDPLVLEAARDVRARRVLVSTARELDEGGWVEDGALMVKLLGGGLERYELPARLPGRHNQENALFALVAARLGGATPAEARAGLLAFRPLPHRMELVAERRGLAFFDDSKGTNVMAVVAAVRALAFPRGRASGAARPVVLIAGGRDKGGDYQPLAAALVGVARAAVLIGEAAPRLAAALGDRVPVQTASSMSDAVKRAVALAQPGDAIVLSPACSSFDMFRDYEHRAEAFREAVQAVAP